MTYAEKLKDPRWQKKRLQILNRDEFKCTLCGDEKTTLHVHHLKYSKEPWEIEDKFLKTLCQDCHSLVEWMKKENRWELEFIQSIYKSNHVDFMKFYCLMGDIQYHPFEQLMASKTFFTSDCIELSDLKGILNHAEKWQKDL